MDNPVIRLIRGERVPRPPFWEVWFAMGGFLNQHYKGDRVAMAKDLGMAAMCIGGVDTNVHFRSRKEASDGSTHYSPEGALKSLAQLEDRPPPDWEPQIERLKAAAEPFRREGIATWVCLPWCFHSAATSMGLEHFALKCYDDIDFIHTLFEWIEQRNRKAIDAVIAEVKPDMVLFDGDCAYKNGLMVRPEMFRELVLERTRETVSHLRELDVPYFFHTDGKLDDVVPVLIELGFGAVHGCEKQANDLEHLVEAFGDDICLIGNMDVVFLSRASQDEVRLETERMLMTGARKGRFAAACNTSPLDYIPDENYMAMAEAIRDFGGGRAW